MRIKDRIKLFMNPDALALYTVREFGHANPDFLIIVADKKTDRMFVMHKNHFINGKVKDASGKNKHIIRDVLSYSRFKDTIDGFLASLVETLEVPLFKGNQFYQMIDGFLFNLARSLRKKRSQQNIKSPFVNINNNKS